jgi:hypothetical protein
MIPARARLSFNFEESMMTCRKNKCIRTGCLIEVKITIQLLIVYG